MLLFAWLIITASFTLFDELDRVKESPAFRNSGGYRKYIYGVAGRRGASPISFADKFTLSRRVAVSGPFCAVAGMLIYGLIDHIFPDERVFLAFCLIAGLCAASIRSTRCEIADFERSFRDRSEKTGTAEAEIRLD